MAGKHNVKSLKKKWEEFHISKLTSAALLLFHITQMNQTTIITDTFSKKNAQLQSDIVGLKPPDYLLL